MATGIQRKPVGLPSVVELLLWSAAFGIAFTQWPLYHENQNTKFLHGLAAAGVGRLNEDWLANTVDPLPAFSWLVFVTQRFLQPWFFYMFQALFLGLYLMSLAGIVGFVFRRTALPIWRLLFLAIMLLLLAGTLPPFSLPVLGTTVSWLLQSGVAAQYLINQVFQPSTFGVLLITSIWLFLADRVHWAAACAALAAVFHSTYLPAAGLLVAIYAGQLLWEDRALRRALTVGLVALVMVLPVLLYNILWLGPTSAALWEQAQSILVNERIPHHSLPEVWVDETVWVKLALVVVAAYLARKSRVLPLLVVGTLFTVGLTVLELRLDSDTLAFIAPWRFSVVLVPLATALIVAALIDLLARGTAARLNGHGRRLVVAVSVLAVTVGVWRGWALMRVDFAAHRADGINGLYAFVRADLATHEQTPVVYLTPTGMADFRLATGAPVVVTWKSHPYLDTEVIEWKARVDAVSAFYGEPHCLRMGELHQEYGVTHILLPGVPPAEECPIVKTVYADAQYTVLAVQ